MATIEGPWQGISIEEFDALDDTTARIKGMSAMFCAVNPEELNSAEFTSAAYILYDEVKKLDEFVKKIGKQGSEQRADRQGEG